MTRRRDAWRWTAALTCIASMAAGQPALPAVVVVETAAGAITLEVDVAHAPVTAANFLRYVDGTFYDGGRFIRAVRPDNTTRHDVEIQVVQAAIDPARAGDAFAAIPLERTTVTGLRHLDGAVSMARTTPDSATSSFFVVIGDQPSLDAGGARNADGQGFAAFGRVTAGMDVVRRIQASATGTAGQFGTETLEPPIAIVRAYRK
ncbi:MAG: peptidylprolyl isomerase [Vicinamibacterales bacterium]